MTDTPKEDTTQEEETSLEPVAVILTDAGKEAAKARVKTVAEDLVPKSPYFFANADDAANFLTKAQEEIPDFGDYPLIANGIDATSGDFNPDVYTDATRIMVHVLTNRGKTVKDAQGNEVKEPATIRALVITPVPTIAAVEADDAGRKWLNKIADTQLAHVAVATLRKSEDLNLARKDMPGVVTTTVASEVEGVDPEEREEFSLASFFIGREAGGVMETYDKLFRGILDGFNAKSPPWKRSRLNKAELKKALESRAYALSVYPALEDRGDKPSLFVMAGQVGVREAKKDGLDPTVFENWLTTRDDKAASTGEDESEDDFTLDDIVLAVEADKPADAAVPGADDTPTQEEPATDQEPDAEEMTEEELEAATAPDQPKPDQPAT